LGKSKTVILTTHVLPEVEALADRVVLIHQGQKVADGSLQQLAKAGDGPQARVVVSGPKDQLVKLLNDVGCEVVQTLHAPLGSAENCGAIMRLPGSGGSDALAAISAAVAKSKLSLLELSSQTGTLETLFKDLQAGAISA